MKISMLLSSAALAVTFAAGSALAQPIEDPVGVVKVREGEPIVIGGWWVQSGPDAALGIDQRRAVEIAFDEVDNKILGHPIRFLAEDSACNAEGGQNAATKLAANRQMVVALGPACSSAATPGAPILWKAGIPSIAGSTSAYSLVAPDRSPDYDGYLVTVFNDSVQSDGDGKWLKNGLGCDTIATIHDGSPYAQQLAKLTSEVFEAEGGKVVDAEAVAPTDIDMRPVLTRIATTKPCAIYLPIFVQAAAQIIRQAKEISGLEDTYLIGSSGLLSRDMISAAGEAVVGFRFTYPDVSPEALGEGYPKFVEAYKEKFGEAPISGYHGNTYDAAQMAMNAIEKVAVKGDDGALYIGRMALRDALLATKNYKGISGTLTCTPTGSCGAFKHAVYEYTSADPDTYELGVNPKKIE